jgi:hypothetical protein
MAKAKYVIKYYIGGKLKETINLNNPQSFIVSRTKIDELKRLGNYKAGKLIPERA